MELTINTALQGLATSIKGKEFLSTAAYVEPFLERMSKYTDKFIINGIPATQLSYTKEGDVNMENMIYNRMWVQAVMPDSAGFDNYDRVVGMVYGLDTRKPVVKFYVGGLNKACCNLCIFDPSFLNVQELVPESVINYKPVDKLLSWTDTVKSTLEKLTEIEIPYNETLINENLGKWVRNSMSKAYTNEFGKVKVATSTAIDAFKLLYQDKESPYYVNPGFSTDMFNIYNAFTQIVTDDKRDLINKCEKTLVIADILGI